MIPLSTQIKNFKNILHIGDIHIRLTKRHQEYLEAFDKLYEAAKNTSDSTLILIAGDLFHNKSDLSPESVKIASDFLKKLADIRPTVLIAGNHDATLTNKNRLDSLSPIVEALNHHNLFYLKETEIYIIGDILFNNYGVFDLPEKYLNYKNIPAIYKNQVNYTIALYHGPVHNAITDVGYVINNRSITIDTFDGHQMVMLGDIHKHQILQEYDYNADKPIIAYCGSLIQQDHGEELKGHGYLYWDLKNKSFKHFEIQNDYGFFTVEVNKGKLTTDITNIPKKAKLRIKCIESVQSELKPILSEIKEISNVTDVSYIRVDENSKNNNIIDITNINLHSISDVDYQNNLIKEFFENKQLKVNNELSDKIFILNKELNESLKKEYTPKNIRWKPKIFEFDNMFSYGESNIIDFSKMTGNMGLFAGNASGKSSILSALSFCLFDKCDRAYRAVNILNTQKMTFRCKFNFEINGIDYFIERKATSDKKRNVKVDVKFWKVVDGKEVELNGEARRNTNDIIKDYIGEYNDFMLTVLSVQNGKEGNFIDMGQTERKDLLAQFMGLNIYDKLNDLATEKYRESTILLKNLNNDDYIENLNIVENNINDLETKISNKNLEIDFISNKKEELNNSLLNLTKKLININSDIIDVTVAETKKINLENQIDTDNNLLINNKNELNQLKLKLKLINDKIDEYNNNNLNEKLNLLNQLKDSYAAIELDLEKKMSIVKAKIDKLSNLQKHEYDPNCNFCVNNIFVKDAIKTKNEIDADKNELKKIKEEFDKCKEQISDLSWVIEDSKLYQNCINEKNSIETKIFKIDNNLLKIENSLNQNKNSLIKLNDQISDFYKQKENIEHNKTINDEINDIKHTINDLNNRNKIKTKELLDLNTLLQSNINNKNNITNTINKVKELENKCECFKLYTQAVNRDGIPYELIIDALPVIEKEVNQILNQIVDFTLSFKTDGKNLSVYIGYDEKNWPLELGSGMEKFISSLAIRVALINISNLPRPNFIIFDEGWGTLDSHHLSEIKLLFDVLKTQFDFVLIISHIDSIKDLVDNLLEINKIDGFSNIQYI